MKACELIPFEKGITAGVDLVMMGHIEYPKVTGNNYPASLSKEIITDKLRGELGFEGAVLTDALAMKAVTSLFPSNVAAITALKAGVDILLMPKEFYRAYDGVINAVSQGQLSEEEIDEHLVRVLKLKMKYLNLT